MPELDLNSFKANLKDVARPNRFLITLTPPAGVAGATNEELAYFCKGASLPGRNVGEVILNWQGMQNKIAGDPTFDPWDVTFLADYDMKARKSMNAWMQLTANQEDNIRTTQDEYKVDIRVDQLGRSKADILDSYILIGAYPSVLAPLDLNTDSVDTVGEFAVTFTYDYYVAA